MDKFVHKDELSPEDQERLAGIEKALVGRELTILLQVLMAEYELSANQVAVSAGMDESAFSS